MSKNGKFQEAIVKLICFVVCLLFGFFVCFCEIDEQKAERTMSLPRNVLPSNGY